MTVGPECRRSRKCRAVKQSGNAAATPKDIGTEIMSLACLLLLFLLLLQNLYSTQIQARSSRRRLNVCVIFAASA